MADAIHLSIEIEASVERVWDAVTNQERLRDWFNADMRLDARPGGRVEFAGVNGNEPYRLAGAITEFDPPRRLTWEWDSVPARWPAPTLLTIELTEQDATVRVDMRHHGWERLPEPDRAAAFEAFRQRWTGDELIPLKELVEGVGPTY